MTDYNEQIKENTIKYLYNLSNAVPSHLTTLKSLYTTRYRIGEERGNLFLAANKDRTKLSCPRCCLRLAAGPSKCVIKPEKKPSKFAKQVNSKAESGKALTTYQRLYFKKLNLNRNQLVTTCSFCRHEIPRLLTKPVKTRPDENMNESIVKKKKKKRKDKFCGLDQSVVSLLTPKTTPVLIDLVTPSPMANKPQFKTPKKPAPNKNTPQTNEKLRLQQETPKNLSPNKSLRTQEEMRKTNKNTPQNKYNQGQKPKSPNKSTPNNNARMQQGKKINQMNKNTPQNKKTLRNNNQSQTPGIQRTTPKSAAKKKKAKKENLKKLSNLVANANTNTKNNLNNFHNFLQSLK